MSRKRRSMDKENRCMQIEKDLIKAIQFENNGTVDYWTSAIWLDDMGYRKADEVRKEKAKEIFQELYNLPVCEHPTIGTGQYTFGRRFVKQWAKEKYGVEVDE